MPIVKNKSQRSLVAAGVELRAGFNIVTDDQLVAIAADPEASAMLRARKPLLVVLDVEPKALGVIVHDAREDILIVGFEGDEPVPDVELDDVEG